MEKTEGETQTNPRLGGLAGQSKNLTLQDA
ncbi:MAG: hypothetical protein UZ21_OP11001000811 [Microgenomates bacterium OLB22]|nr:MAG: hypothetical protein UZ21_OP11001000811 [Microgenomates bacterium OLB22]